MTANQERQWPLRLFTRSVLKQRKFREISALLGQSQGLSCLDIGADNGVISFLLRERGGRWKSADLDAQTVGAIMALVQADVYQIDGRTTPFADDEFDRIVIVDFLEHIPDDAAFAKELFRILKPGGTLIVNVPHVKRIGMMRPLRGALGQTDDKHGHLRPGYTVESLRDLFGDYFALEAHTTYSRFFSELIDALIVYAVSRLKRDKGHSQKGLIVTGQDLSAYRSLFRIYSLIYPVVWLVAKLDALLFFTSGYMLVARARVNKESTVTSERGGA
jgi:SAM-dependent methyltransferase